jgi:hypothetical protein
MASTSVLIFFSVAVALAFSAPPVFLEENGSQICTLNNLGNIVKGPVTYPVYQKVCREIIPSMGKPISTLDQEDKGLRRSEKANDSAELVRRAIMMQNS